MTAAQPIIADDETACAAPIAVRREVDSTQWDDYVRDHPDGTFFHLHGWLRIIQSVYGYDFVPLAAFRDDEIVGVMPLVDVKAPLTGRALVSTAFTVGGGPLAENDEARAALAAAAIEAGRERNVRYVESRGNAALPGWIQKDGVYADFTITIPADEDANLKAIPRKRRAEIRKALAAEAAGELVCELSDDADLFYRLYAQSLRTLGTPIFPKRFATELVKEFRDAVKISTVRHRGNPVAALLSFDFRDTVLPYYIGAAQEARAARAFEYVYWKEMRRAVVADKTLFNFGRSRINSGPYHFKRLWGIEPTMLTANFHLVEADEPPNLNPNNQKFAGAIAAWKRLPVAATTLIGPHLARNFP